MASSSFPLHHSLNHHNHSNGAPQLPFLHQLQPQHPFHLNGTEHNFHLQSLPPLPHLDLNPIPTFPLQLQPPTSNNPRQLIHLVPPSQTQKPQQHQFQQNQTLLPPSLSNQPSASSSATQQVSSPLTAASGSTESQSQSQSLSSQQWKSPLPIPPQSSTSSISKSRPVTQKRRVKEEKVARAELKEKEETNQATSTEELIILVKKCKQGHPRSEPSVCQFCQTICRSRAKLKKHERNCKEKPKKRIRKTNQSATSEADSTDASSSAVQVPIPFDHSTLRFPPPLPPS